MQPNNAQSFTEKSGMPNGILIAIILFIPVIFIAATQFNLPINTITNPSNALASSPWYITYWLDIVVILAVLTLLYSIRLTVKITPEQFSFTYFPFTWKPKTFTANEIQSIELIHVKPIRNFGGWGLRFGLGGTAYTSRGKTVAKIELKNHKRLFVTVLNTAQALPVIQLLNANAHQS